MAGDEVLEWFEAEFWPTYPRKRKKPDALRAARKCAKTPEAREAIMTGLRKQLPWFEIQKNGKDWDGNPEDYRPYPATWLNGECWNDEVTAGATESEPVWARTVL
jgi:hypothetical protein